MNYTSHIWKILHIWQEMFCHRYYTNLHFQIMPFLYISKQKMYNTFKKMSLCVICLGSPWSASEPSIEPEGPGSTGGVEDNYHRNMSWLHVSASILTILCVNYYNCV